MVVKYPVPTQSSNLTFFTHTWRIIFQRNGSIVPKLGPQIFLSVGLSCLAMYYNPLTEVLEEDAQPQSAYVVVGFLCCFLTFFKTQTAYAEFWSAYDAVEDVLAESRRLGLMACTILDWEVDISIKPIARRVLRLIVLQYFVTTEFLCRTGPNKTEQNDIKDRLREDIRLVTGPNEFLQLFPDEPQSTPARESQHRHANPIQVMLWIQLMFMEAQAKGAVVTAPALNMCIDGNFKLFQAFWDLNKVDKTQFPFPYAQLVKILVCFYVLTYPFVLEPTCGVLTPLAMLIIAIGFFGCEEVAGILESPFGTDPNDIDLKYYGAALIRDLELLYYQRESKAEFVFDDTNDLDFSDMLTRLGYTSKACHGTAIPRSLSSKWSNLRMASTGRTRKASIAERPELEDHEMASQGSASTVVAPAGQSSGDLPGALKS